jgi:hypothetical protein
MKKIQTNFFKNIIKIITKIKFIKFIKIIGEIGRNYSLFYNFNTLSNNFNILHINKNNKI